jgi:hypothetical protein
MLPAVFRVLVYTHGALTLLTARASWIAVASMLLYLLGFSSMLIGQKLT